MRGGVQIRQAAATAREALIAHRGGPRRHAGRGIRHASTARCGRRSGGAGIRFGELVGDKRFERQGRSEGERCAIPRRTRSSASRSRGPTSRARSPAGTCTSTTSRSTACCTGASCGRRRSARSSLAVDEASIKATARRARRAHQRFPRRRRRERMGRRLRRAAAEGALVGFGPADRRRGRAGVDARRSRSTPTRRW